MGNYDIPWNPRVSNKQGRLHRYGQTAMRIRLFNLCRKTPSRRRVGGDLENSKGPTALSTDKSYDVIVHQSQGNLYPRPPARQLLQPARRFGRQVEAWLSTQKLRE
jgi:hypothetical protein